jgi:hypothetical protein
MLIKVVKNKWKREIEGIKVRQSWGGIRIQIVPDEAMQKRWQHFIKTEEFRTTVLKDIPEEILLKFLTPLEGKVLFFNKEEQTPNFVLQVVLWKKQLLEKKNRNFTVLLMELAIGKPCMFSEVLLDKNGGEEGRIKTVILVGDTTTGLLYNL